MMQNNNGKNIRVAITGGIGSGKSTVAAMIGRLGYKVISFDDVYRDLLKRKEFVLQICDLISVPPIYTPSGDVELDKSAVASKVFCDKAALDKLNGFTHPKITAEAFLQGGDGVVFFEVPLLFESGLQTEFDRIIVVTRPLEDRISCAALRDGVPREKIESRVKNQTDYEKIDLSLHIVISNDGDLPSLENKVRKAINEL